MTKRKFSHVEGGAHERVRRAAKPRAAHRAPDPLRVAGWLERGALTLVLAATAWLQWPALRMPFFADDYLFLDQVRQRSLLGAWAAPDPFQHFFLRPLGRQVWFWLVRLTGESPVVAHVANLALLLVILVLLHRLVRRLAGPFPALVAVAFLGLHYAADVVVRWASGSQDLLAIAGALGALLALQSGRQAWAVALLGIALLAKETVVVTPVVALALFRRPGEPWRESLARAAPLALAAACWGSWWLVQMLKRPDGPFPLTLDAVPAALAHLPQVIVGAEWLAGTSWSAFTRLPPLGPWLLAFAGVGLALAARGRRERTPAGLPGPTPPEAATDWRRPAVWALAGALPITAAVYIWSAYYYLFALCGVAWLAGVLLARRRAAVVLATLALLACGSHAARSLEGHAEFPGNWKAASTFNRFRLDRAGAWTWRFLGQLRASQSTIPPRSTVFFAGIPTHTAWQIGDGALLRWAYRDSSARSYFLREFTLERAQRGPVFFYYARDGVLERARSDGEGLRSFALGEALANEFARAEDALLAARAIEPDNGLVRYALAWLTLARGDSATARAELRAAGCLPVTDAAGSLHTVHEALGARDTTVAVQRLGDVVRRHPLDPEAHGLMADVLLRRSPGSRAAVVEALAAWVLAPQRADARDRWVGLAGAIGVRGGAGAASRGPN